MIELLFLWGCSTPSDATLYSQALKEPDFEKAFGLCEKIQEEQASGDCAVAVMEHLHRRERSDCQRLKPGIWREECIFLYAERAAAEGRLREGFAACNQTGFGRECSFHLIRQGVRSVLELPPTEAGTLLMAYQDLPWAPDADWLFWKTYWRQRLEAGKPVEPNTCADEICEMGAKACVYELLEVKKNANLPRFCEMWHSGLDVSQKSWVHTELTDGWVKEWADHHCGPAETPTPLPSVGKAGI